MAAVTAVIYLGWRAPSLTSPANRSQSFSVWQTVTFLLNSLLFILVMLQPPGILAELPVGSFSYASLAFYGLVVSLAVIVARFVPSCTSSPSPRP